MASGGKTKTTFGKLAREQKLRQRRQDKRAKTDARKPGGEIVAAPFGETTPTAGGR
jgi:hypothetical protein